MALKPILQLLYLGGKILIQSGKGRLIRSLNFRSASTSPLASSKPGPKLVEKNTGRMDISEAYKILDINSNTPINEVENRFINLFNINDKKKGGSFYLQSKIVRALERIDQERGL